jgi:hypothetical protein
MRLRPHQEALCCLISTGLLLFLNRKTEKKTRVPYTDPGGIYTPLRPYQKSRGYHYALKNTARLYGTLPKPRERARGKGPGGSRALGGTSEFTSKEGKSLGRLYL